MEKVSTAWAAARGTPRGGMPGIYVCTRKTRGFRAKPDVLGWFVTIPEVCVQTLSF